jgi:hypothetical protein
MVRICNAHWRRIYIQDLGRRNLKEGNLKENLGADGEGKTIPVTGREDP